MQTGSPAAGIPRFNVLGVGVSALSLDLATERVIARAQARPAAHVCLAGVHGLVEAQSDSALRETYNRAFLATPDGMPLVWLGRRLGHRSITRVYGPDLLLSVCDRGRAAGLRHFFLGGLPGVAATLADRLTARFPGLQVAGEYSPPFRPLTADEVADLQKRFERVRPDIVWVGLSTPKQEQFMTRHAGELPAGLFIGVGAAFDFHSGRKSQAPRWIQRSGFEWLFRLVTEPRRLAGRYLRVIPQFCLLIFLQLTGLKRIDPIPPAAEPGLDPEAETAPRRSA